MIEVGLKYLGKKAPFTLSPAYLETPVQIHKVKDFVFWVPKKAAARLFADNPRMFQKMGERGDDGVVIQREEMEISRDPFAERTKREIKGYAQEKFGVELDMRSSRDDLIRQVKEMEAEEAMPMEEEEIKDESEPEPEE